MLPTRILLVDDDAVQLKGLQRRLEMFGHVVVACHGGGEALAVLSSQNFDVMLTDVQMPGLSGLSLLRAVREHDFDLPVVLMSGALDREPATDGAERGVFRYLLKPVPSEELDAIVRSAATIARMARSKRAFVEEFGSAKFSVAEPVNIDAVLDRPLTR